MSFYGDLIKLKFELDWKCKRCQFRAAVPSQLLFCNWFEAAQSFTGISIKSKRFEFHTVLSFGQQYLWHTHTQTPAYSWTNQYPEIAIRARIDNNRQMQWITWVTIVSQNGSISSCCETQNSLHLSRHFALPLCMPFAASFCFYFFFFFYILQSILWLYFE